MQTPIPRTILALVGATGILVVGCARGNANNDPSRGSGVPSSQMAVAGLQGDWVLHAEPPLPATGMRITVTVDSVRGPDVFGRLTHFFSGNVGTDPLEYHPFTGSVDDEGDVAFTIEKRDRPLMGIEVAGQVHGDTLRLRNFVIGPDTVTGGNRAWFFVKDQR